MKKFSAFVAAVAVAALPTGVSGSAETNMTVHAAVPMAMMAASCGDGKDRKVKIINETGVQMNYFFASPSGVDSWEDDIFGNNKVLGPYASINVNFDDGRCMCVYDFKAVFADDDVLVKKNINVCRIGTYRYDAG